MKRIVGKAVRFVTSRGMGRQVAYEIRDGGKVLGYVFPRDGLGHSLGGLSGAQVQAFKEAMDLILS